MMSEAKKLHAELVYPFHEAKLPHRKTTLFLSSQVLKSLISKKLFFVLLLQCIFAILEKKRQSF